MDPWTLGLVAVVVIGLGLILYGALFDRRRNRRAREEMLSPPKRDIPQFRPDAAPPQYLSELQARRPPTDPPPTGLSERERQDLAARLKGPDAVAITTGYASRSFVNEAAEGWVVLDDPAVLVCSSSVDTIREVLPLLERAAVSRHPLVIAAPAFAPDVLATLEVNVIQRMLRFLAVCGDKHTLATVAAHTGARPLDRSDLQAGFHPADHLGHCGRWVADKQQSWLLAPAPAAASEATPE